MRTATFDIHFLTPVIESSFNQLAPGVKVSINTSHVSWAGWRHPFTLELKGTILSTESPQAKISVPHAKAKLKLSSFLFGGTPVASIIFDDANVELGLTKVATLSGAVKLSGETWSIQSHFSGIDLASIPGNIPSPVILESGFSYLGGIHSIVSGTLSLTYNQKKGLDHLSIDLRSDEATLGIPELFPFPLKLQNVSVNIVADRGKLTLKSFKLHRGKASALVTGEIQNTSSWEDLWNKGGSVKAQFEIEAHHVPADDLTNSWPLPLTPEPRGWITHNLSKGEATYVTTKLAVEGMLLAKGFIKTLKVLSIEGNIDAEGVLVHHYGKLPPVHNAKGHCTFTRDTLDIKASGQINGLDLYDGHVIINKLDEISPEIHMDLHVKGDLQHSLGIIDYEPLSLSQKLDLDPKKVSGQADTNVILHFPLEYNVPLNLVHVRATSKITGGGINVSPLMPFKVHNGTFDVAVDKRSLNLNGRGKINGVRADFNWIEYFPKRSVPFHRQFKIKGAMQARDLDTFTLSVTPYIARTVGFDISITEALNGDVHSKIRTQLKDAHIQFPLTLWEKKKGIPATLLIEAHSKPNVSTFPATYTFSCEDSILTGSAEIQKHPHALKTLTVKELKLGKTHLRGTIVQKNKEFYAATFRGDTLDLRNFIRDDAHAESQPSSPKKTHKTFAISLDINTVFLSDTLTFNYCQAEALYGRHLTEFHASGVSQDGATPLVIDLTPIGENKQKLVVKAENGGRLLDLYEAGYGIKGGALEIIAVQNTSGDQAIVEGDMSLRHFSVTKAPLLTRILAVASIKGIVNLLSGQGIDFSEGSSHFIYSEKKLQLSNLKAANFVLGLLASGTINKKKQKLDINCDVVPLYFLNKIAANVPFFGTILSGNNGEAILATHVKLSGNISDPELTINPLSMVTPYLFRQEKPAIH